MLAFVLGNEKYRSKLNSSAIVDFKCFCEIYMYIYTYIYIYIYLRSHIKDMLATMINVCKKKLKGLRGHISGNMTKNINIAM